MRTKFLPFRRTGVRRNGRNFEATKEMKSFYDVISFDERVIHILPLFNVCFCNLSGNISNAAYISCTLVDTYRFTCIKQVESVRALEAVVVGGKNEFFVNELQCFFFI